MTTKHKAAALFIAGLFVAASAQAKPVVAAAPAAKISKARAQAIALKLAPGKLISSEYENEGGGWRYSFDIQQKGNVQEIGVNAMTGAIVENKSEGKVDRD
jgi:uncharacterized membrane protein YkoI